MEMIKLNEVLKIMDSGATFSVSFVTLDKRRKTGGKIREIPEAKLNQVSKVKETSSTPSKSKAPNHWTNCTRSLKLMVDGIESSTIRKLHIFLIVKFNGKKVYL